MKDALVVMNPRTVAPALAALERLRIPRIHLKGYTEAAIAFGGWPEVIRISEASGYEWLWLVSDDAIVTPEALRAVREVARRGKRPVVTGYSQRDHNTWVVNLTDQPLVGTNWSGPGDHSYSFLDYRDVITQARSVFRTWFTGMSLTGMSLDLWRQFPFACYGDPGWSSDFHLSIRLQEADVPIAAVRGGFCYHWRNHWVYSGDGTDERTDTEIRSIEHYP